MARRGGLTLPLALKVLQELPSESESDNADSSDTEMYAPETRSMSWYEFSDSDDVSVGDSDSDEDLSQSGPSTQPQAPTWIHKQRLQKTLPDFASVSGPNDDLWELPEKSPIAVFREIFSVKLMEHIVIETNLYATQRSKPFTPVTLVELYIFLGLNLLMGIKRMPNYTDYWSYEEALGDPFISQHMSRSRFAWILGNLHLNNNELQPKRGEANFDRLYKVRPLLDHLSKSFLDALHPSQNQSIDESIIEFKERSWIKRHMDGSKELIKRGFKVWMRCDESGFASEFEIYSGEKEVVEKNLGENVVKRLTEHLHGKHHRVFMDDYFTTYELFRYLKTKQIYACGTTKIHRKNLPRNLLSQDKDLKRGDFDWAVSSDEIICLKWKDNQCVTSLSSLPDAVDPIQIQRKKKDGTKVSINCPKAVSTYNANIGFVGKFDQLISLYEMNRKSKKWWHRIFFHFVDVAVINSYILHKILSPGEIKTALEFRLNLLHSLCTMSETTTLKRPLPSSNPDDAPPDKVKVSGDKQFTNVDDGAGEECAQKMRVL